tara:strand:- start:152 stop:667 length:516 start_codon:yes stop_codon:yes gene_type:complete
MIMAEPIPPGEAAEHDASNDNHVDRHVCELGGGSEREQLLLEKIAKLEAEILQLKKHQHSRDSMMEVERKNLSLAVKHEDYRSASVVPEGGSGHTKLLKSESFQLISESVKQNTSFRRALSDFAVKERHLKLEDGPGGKIVLPGYLQDIMRSRNDAGETNCSFCQVVPFSA